MHHLFFRVRQTSHSNKNCQIPVGLSPNLLVQFHQEFFQGFTPIPSAKDVASRQALKKLGDLRIILEFYLVGGFVFVFHPLTASKAPEQWWFPETIVLLGSGPCSGTIYTRWFQPRKLMVSTLKKKARQIGSSLQEKRGLRVKPLHCEA